MQLRRFLDSTQIEVDIRLVLNLDEILVLACFITSEMRTEITVGSIHCHGIGNMSYAAQPGSLQRQLWSGNIDPHSTNNDRDILLPVKNQPEIINTFHRYPWTTVKVGRLAFVSSGENGAKNTQLRRTCA